MRQMMKMLLIVYSLVQYNGSCIGTGIMNYSKDGHVEGVGQLPPCFCVCISYIYAIMLPGVGDDAAAADSQGFAVVSISIGATSDGRECSFKDDQAYIYIE